MYRIIVTRHYAIYDGSKFMHMYFIPMLSRFDHGRMSVILALLSVATRYKSIFLEKESDLCLPKFQAEYEVNAFKEKLQLFVRQFLLIEDESHVYRLDDPSRYMDIYPEAKPTEVANVYQEWRKRRNELVECANETLKQLSTEEIKISEGIENPEEFEKLEKARIYEMSEKPSMLRWNNHLEAFNKYVDPINKGVGTSTSHLLGGWFEAGGLSQP
jgi:hypothetical protein